ncbi:MAG: patatin-like phospholipase family protein [Rudaea sp.]|uniref:patatin-like phospholipase family protein n=1 Tax=unclassified Rudaea TaxID=2627037 RepID=UPI0010F5BFA4|nr:MULTISPECIES: patatin-like phospholipase family protein [unclassified Rudaea]MBN8885296.1 patatin-like phospholipase family protein [Rudaea sp.]
MNASDPATPIADLRAFLRGIDLFAPLDAAGIDELAAELEPRALPGGAVLFDEGDPADALYVVRTGGLAAYRRESGASLLLLGMVGVGEVAGEISLIAQIPRRSLLRALRDSVVLRLSAEAFHRLVAKYPQAMLHTVGVTARHLLDRPGNARYSPPRTFAILPHDAGVDAQGFVRSLATVLSSYGSCALIDAATAQGRDAAWLHSVELAHRYVLLLGDANDAGWRERCARQADAFLLPVNAADEASAWPEVAYINAERSALRTRHLVLLHQGDVGLGRAAAWLAQVRGARHHHVRGDRAAADIERIARLLIGRSMGLVLSGGGARGFAQIGVVHALRESGQQIDYVGGTSIGAIIGAGVAADWSGEEMFYNYRRAFVDGRPLRDYTFPFVSLTRGRRVARLLREAFGERDLSDLVLPFYAVTANLTVGAAQIHRAGPLWLWLRAASAIPGVLPPVFHRGEVFVDGAVINNLPVDPMREHGIGDVIGIDIGADDVLRAQVEEFALPSAFRLALQRLRGRRLRPGIVNILLRAGMVNSEAASTARRAETSLLLAPPVQNVGLLDWHKYEQAIAAGYRYAREVLGRGAKPRGLP